MRRPGGVVPLAFEGALLAEAVEGFAESLLELAAESHDAWCLESVQSVDCWMCGIVSGREGREGEGARSLMPLRVARMGAYAYIGRRCVV